MKYNFIGRTTSFKGKTLWEILANLKNFGVGRLIVRNRFQRYEEPTYLKVLKVGALPPPVNVIRPEFSNVIEERRCMVRCERIFRGKSNTIPGQITVASYKTDYQLVPKDEEYKYLKPVENEEPRILSKTMIMPPLLRELTIRGMKAKGLSVTEEPRMEVYYNLHGMEIKNYRIAKDGETPTIIPGTRELPKLSLYANVKPI